MVEPKGIDGPLDTFASFKSYPPLDFTEVVRPNFETLYTTLWMDLTEEPKILSLPDAKGRYYLAPTLPMWTDVIAAPGWRTTGTGAADYAYVPPGWEGTLPDGVVRVESATCYLWMIGRTAASGPDDYDAVHEFQAGMKVTPLSQWGKDWKSAAGTVDPSIDTKTPPLQQVEDMSAKDFFAYGAELMELHPPKNTDYSQVWRMARIGLIPGEDFAMNIGPTSDMYLLHFDTDQIPPVGAFWSITMYDDDGFADPNSLDRGNLASRMDLKFNEDGSLDLYVGATSPGKDKESNWLPAPLDKPWNVCMRRYAPKTAALNGTWNPPPLKQKNRPSNVLAAIPSPHKKAN